jgi:hypothetical protein
MTPFLKYLLTWTAGCLMGGGFVFAVAKPVLDHGPHVPLVVAQ